MGSRAAAGNLKKQGCPERFPPFFLAGGDLH
jgi:hypothetical protein